MNDHAVMLPSATRQIFTRFADGTKRTLVTELSERRLRPLRDGEILVAMLFVPIHGSFWLASHPARLHPRTDEFMEREGFVFGNGGVGRVVARAGATAVEPGDYVAVFGHVPCGHDDCHACTVVHRYVECEFRESRIIGHGRGAHDGTYACHAILPPHSYDVCYHADERPTAEALAPHMYAFLVADVRNALTRHPETLTHRRTLLVGAGLSGHIAAYLHLRSAPEARLVVVDPSESRAEAVKSLAPDRVASYVPDAGIIGRLNDGGALPPGALDHTIDTIAAIMYRHFSGRTCDVVFDASSGNTAPLWANPRILSAGCHAVPFGFASASVVLGRDLLQLSGLTILMSRGVGDVSNRRQVLTLLKDDGARFVDRWLMRPARRLSSLEEAIAFVHQQHARPPGQLHEIPHAYMTPTSL
jgi:threonine dehydrogenase-like Zn-dependent dehydrogenase